MPTMRSRGTRITATGLRPPPGSRVRASPNGGSNVAINVADDRRRAAVTRQFERVGGYDVKTGQPHAKLASLRWVITSENRSNWVNTTLNPQPKHRESPLCFRRRCQIAGGMLQPSQKLVQMTTKLAAPHHKVFIDGRLGLRSSAAAGSIVSCTTRTTSPWRAAPEGRGSRSSIARV